MTPSRGAEDPIRAVALLEEPTRRRLYEMVVAGGQPVGRDDAAEALGISRELAAFHLDRLAGAGLLDVEYRRRNGKTGPGAGRPAKLYRRASGEVAVSLPARHYDLAADLMATAIERLDPGVGAEALAAVARERGAATGADARRTLDRAEPPAGIETLVAALRDAGFEPDVDAEAGTVGLRNCPYRALAGAHRDLTCGMNLAWAEGVIEGLASPVDVELAPGAGRCCVVFHDRTRCEAVTTDGEHPAAGAAG
jgi:predicted ArsR family transcriptional regulator